jgi:hypothetical protein
MTLPVGHRAYVHSNVPDCRCAACNPEAAATLAAELVAYDRVLHAEHLSVRDLDLDALADGIVAPARGSTRTRTARTRCRWRGCPGRWAGTSGRWRSDDVVIDSRNPE